MNLADYLSELLGYHDEVNIPGLGYFTRAYKSSYYNEQDAMFYPPAHQVKFVAQLKEDDTFAQYVADKKNISLASAKYFTEKFVNTIREQALVGKYVFADIGFFYEEQKKLAFEPYDKVATDASFYGYYPVNLFKLAEPIKHSVSVIEPAAIPLPYEPPAEVIEEIPEPAPEILKRRGPNPWVVTLLVIVIIALAIFGILSFYPGALTRLKYQYVKFTQRSYTPPPIRLKAKPDTSKTVNKTTDTVPKTTAPSINGLTKAVSLDDTVKSRFEIIAANYNRAHKAAAESVINQYKAKGMAAKFAKGIPGNLLKISVGTYPTYQEAETARLDLVKSGKISKKITNDRSKTIANDIIIFTGNRYRP